MSIQLKILLIYLAAVSFLSVCVCIYDKIVSKKNNVKLRIPEKSLLIWSAVGGSVAMYICMQLIRHKTQHKKFMIGIPAIMVVQAAIIGVCFYMGWL